jgi:hypothetical protein
MNLHILKPRFHLLVGLLIILVAISPAQTSDIVCSGSWKKVGSSGSAPLTGHITQISSSFDLTNLKLFGR